MEEGRRELRAIRPISFGWGKRPRHPVRSRPKPTPRPNEHVRQRVRLNVDTLFIHSVLTAAPRGVETYEHLPVEVLRQNV